MRTTLFLTLAFMNCFAQTQKTTFTGNYKNAPFNQFVSEFEASTGYQVYYKPSDFESFLVNIKCDSLPVDAVFDALFSNTQYYFGIDMQKNVFLTHGHYIVSELPKEFSGKKKDDTAGTPQFAFSDDDSNQSVEKKIHFIGRVSKYVSPGNAVLTGFVKEYGSGQSVTGASIYCEELGKGVATDTAGAYTFTVPKGNYTLKITAVGLLSTVRKISVYGDGKLEIQMREDVRMLNDIVVESDRDLNIKAIQMGVQKIDIKTIKKFAAPMGEVDIMRVVLSLPGVQTVGEASNGLNVRGGSASQNLILYNNAVVYNPTHLFGFFTAFNADEMQSVEVQKGAFPAEQGGRLSSIIDIRSRKGNEEKFVGTGGIGLLTSRLTLEGPIQKGKTSFLVGARSSYSDWLLRRVPNQMINNSTASFYDVNFSVSHKVNNENVLFLSGYMSKDKFKLNDDSLYNYKNQVLSLRWNRNFSDRLMGSVTLSSSRYDYSVSSVKNPTNAFELTSMIGQYDAKANFVFHPSAKHSITFGANAIIYNTLPGSIKPRGDSSLIKYNKLQQERGVENAVFMGDSFELNPRLLLYGGLRYSFFFALGPKAIYQYIEGVPKSDWTIIDTLYVRALRSSAIYHGPEYRLSARWAFDNNLSIKGSYSLTRQYLQMLSNTTAISPTDVWKLSDQHIKPQIGNQLSLGLFKNFQSGKYEVSIESYYKWMNNILDYKDGASLLLNHTIESDVLNARGMAYGVEFMVKKPSGKLNGWASYVFSRSYLQTRSNFASETVNGGRYYPSNYDKPHAINLTANYSVSHRFSVSLNVTHSTGRPITLPLAKYTIEEATRLFYSERNQYRVPDYFRADIGFNIEGNHRIKKLAHSSWTIGIYNLTGRKNVYSVFFRSEGANIRGYKMSIFGTPIPSITYNFRF
jgi:hypothetical protein